MFTMNTFRSFIVINFKICEYTSILEKIEKEFVLYFKYSINFLYRINSLNLIMDMKMYYL